MFDNTLVFSGDDIEDDFLHFLKPDDYDDSLCGAKWSSGSGEVDMVDCPDCLQLIKEGANTRHSDPYNYGERALRVGAFDDPTKEWPDCVDWEHDGTYDLDEGLELMTDEWIKDGQWCRATIMSLRENCKALLYKVEESYHNPEHNKVIELLTDEYIKKFEMKILNDSIITLRDYCKTLSKRVKELEANG